MKESGNVFAAFTPVAWPAGAPGWIADLSDRTCIVSLDNEHNRPFRLKLKSGQKQYTMWRNAAAGPCVGTGGNGVALFVAGGENYCGSDPSSFEIDAEAERKAGFPPLPFAYDKALLSGVDDGKGVARSHFALAELECYTLDA